MPRTTRPSRFLAVAFLVLLLTSPLHASADGSRDAPLPPSLEGLPEGEPASAILTLRAPLTPDRADALREAGLQNLEQFEFVHAVAADGTPHALAAAYRFPFVRDVTPSEPLEAHLAETRAVIEADRIPRRMGLTGANVTVAVVDSGIDADHPAFGDRVLRGMKFRDGNAEESRRDDDGHGTHIAGIVAGNGAESRDRRLRGVAPEADLVGLDISDPFTTRNALRAFQWIHDHHEEHGIQVVTNSWGRDRDDAHYDPDDPLVRASNALVADGLVVVFSAGNRGPDRASLTLEAMNPNVITVGATDDRGHVEGYSSRGPAVGEDGDPVAWTKPDVVAPGSHVVSARTQDGDGELHALVNDPEDRYYVEMNGTSMATPHVAAVAALLLERDPGLTPLAVKAILQETALDVGPDGPDPAYGHGLVNAHGALQALATAEGEEVVVRSTRHVPVQHEGEVVAAGDGVVVEDGTTRTPPGDGVDVPLEVPERGRSVNLTLTWEDPRARFTVTLHHGDRTLGPYRPDGDADRVVLHAEPPEPGDWTVHLDPGDSVTRTTWSLDGHVAVVETRVVQRPSAADVQDAPAFRGEGTFFEERSSSSGDAFLRAVDVPMDPPSIPAASALGLVSLAVGLVLRVRGSRSGI